MITDDNELAVVAELPGKITNVKIYEVEDFQFRIIIKGMKEADNSFPSYNENNDNNVSNKSDGVSKTTSQSVLARRAEEIMIECANIRKFGEFEFRVILPPRIALKVEKGEVPYTLRNGLLYIPIVYVGAYTPKN